MMTNKALEFVLYLVPDAAPDVRVSDKKSEAVGVAAGG